MKVLLTGGAGFIGSHIAEELIKENYEVIILDSLVTGQEHNIPAGVKFYHIDICANLDPIFLAEKPDYVIHQAAQVSVSNSFVEPKFDGESNIIGTINLLNACVRYGTKKFIFASTAALYGNPKYLSIDEEHPVSPISFYGLSKLNAESYIKLFSDLYGLSYTILRYSNVYGMRQDKKGEAGVVAVFIEKILKKQTLNIFGDGLQTRDFVFVKDVAKANAAAILYGDNEIINISNHSQISIKDIVNELTELLQSEILPIYHEERGGDIRHSCLSNNKAFKLLKWEPQYTFLNGLRETVAYCQMKQVQLKA
ncbi:UDP-glucose 4-epimerase [Sporosarcina globispora]|uniref:UDP-glucose 4-epimerase n=1 Tax=Sporosarcina globispora TaxID=1459 RepID=A0A0M0G9W7_SPOGL|nr:NAD-dependent epimerase/dehydratase family protein [Sporosarcina globispora]KON86543.1 UDP-glucose 4-epimerase [Sporosarcina globispora]